jgi:hypothetical protein
MTYGIRTPFPIIAAKWMTQSFHGVAHAVIGVCKA